MPRIIFILLLCLSQSAFAAHKGERDIILDTQRLVDQTRYLQQTMDGYTKYNRNYWGSEHNKSEEVKLLFDVHGFIASIMQFNELVSQNKIEYTYYELPDAFQRVLEDFVDMDEQVKLLDGQRGSRREFDRHFNLNAIRRDAEDIQRTLQRLSPVIKGIRPVAVKPQPAAPVPPAAVQPTERVKIETLRLFKADSRKPKYEITGQIAGQVSSARIIVQRSFSGAKQYNVEVTPQGKFRGYFRNYWNATSITLEIRFTNGETYTQAINVGG